MFPHKRPNPASFHHGYNIWLVETAWNTQHFHFKCFNISTGVIRKCARCMGFYVKNGTGNKDTGNNGANGKSRYKWHADVKFAQTRTPTLKPNPNHKTQPQHQYCKYATFNYLIIWVLFTCADNFTRQPCKVNTNYPSQ